MLSGLWRLGYQSFHPPPEPTASFAGKTILITGANTGLGLEASVKFVALGVSSLIIGCRNAERGQKAKEVIEQRTQRTGIVQIWPLDMGNFKSVKEFADRVNKEVVRLDSAVLNAGSLQRAYKVSPDGWEETLQVNTLSTVLLGLLLLPKLRANSTLDDPAHLSFVSSGSHMLVKPERLRTDGNLLEHLSDEARFIGQSQYAISKLLLEFAVKNIANRVRQDNGQIDVIVNSMSPGFCRSGLGRQFNKFYERWLMIPFYWIFARTTEEGSRSLVNVTLQGAEIHGKFWNENHYPDDKPTSLTRTEEGLEFQNKAWGEMIEVLERVSPEVKELAS
ncbi:hypothetical protein AJ80_00087 [Polytolypa hystricis UAMH7299]|uniref:Uncharacterized protein n=1 Tax=Polytolypa hystricis (strain UAMH7299) TaxID=1447883 RepID=A0A2B7Z5S1_POLH7|nr:hypothetical protein AJ80_00087 [Polytolypa hystricis UAMH7299]